MNVPFGFVVIDKPEGLTSHACVQRLRRVFGIKRVGHGGTLDPAVTGVLPIAVGNATRLLTFLPGSKSYQGCIQLGIQTTTDDLDGEVIRQRPWPSLQNVELETILKDFCGAIQQRPPMVSAVHIDGERAYVRARRGEVLELPKRTVIIHQLELLNWDPMKGRLELNLHCSSGTYVRSLARDLGERLNCGGCLARLRRTQALGFNQDMAIALPDWPSNAKFEPPSLLPPILALRHLPSLKLSKDEEQRWRCGQMLVVSPDRCVQGILLDDQIKTADIGEVPDKTQQAVVMLDADARIAGIGSWHADELLKPVVVFNGRG